MISTHKYTEQIALHEKCGFILEQLNKYINYFNNAENNLAEYDKAERRDMIKLIYSRGHFERQVELYRHFIARTTTFYSKHLNKLHKLMFDSQQPGSTIVVYRNSFVSNDTKAKFHFQFDKTGNLVEPLDYGTAELTSHFVTGNPPTP